PAYVAGDVPSGPVRVVRHSRRHGVGAGGERMHPAPAVQDLTAAVTGEEGDPAGDVPTAPVGGGGRGRRAPKRMDAAIAVQGVSGRVDRDADGGGGGAARAGRVASVGGGDSR